MDAAMQNRWRAWRSRRDAAAFEALVEPEISYAVALARRMGARGADADDIVQDSLVQLAQEQSDDPVDVGLRAWICRRVVLRSKMHVRASSRRRRHERAAPRLVVAEPDPYDVRDEVETALKHLSEDERRAVVLRYLHDLDYREVAYVLGVSENACRIRVHKAIRKLRGLLGERAPLMVAALGLPVVSAKAAAAAVIAPKSGVVAGLVVGAKAAAVAGALTVATVAVLPKTEAPAPPQEPAATRARVEPPTPPAEAPRGPDGLALLRDHFAGDKDARPRLERFDELAAFVDRGGRRIVLGPGVHHIEPFGFHWVLGIGVAEPDPGRDATSTRRGKYVLKGSLTFEGAGIDKTTLIATKLPAVRVGGRSRGIVFKDLTYEGAIPRRERFGGNLLDVRGQAVALFHNVRFRHWSLAGYRAPVGVAGSALLLFRDCEFVGGYRRRHGGYALSVRGDTLAVFERCRFSDLDGVVAPHWRKDPPSSRGAVHMRDCTLIETPAFPPRAPQPEYTVTLHGCEQVSAKRPTLRDLRAVVDGLAPRRVRAVRSLTWAGARSVYFQVAVEGGAMFLVEQRRGVFEPVDETGFSLRTLHAQEEGPALGEIDEWPDLDEPARLVRAVKGRIQTGR
ncbi:MAG: RNA polymerase sigma factor [Planctomycetota bacterium]|jgi:RNA polymerase sigma-70 factor (ECF subfamily)